MGRLFSETDLENHRKSLAAKIIPDKPSISLCVSTGCGAFGADRLAEVFREEINKRGLDAVIDLKLTGCHGFCEKGPIIVINPGGIFYQRCRIDNVPDIIEKTLMNNQIIEELLYEDPVTGKKIVHERDIPFYNKQHRIVLGNNGRINPTSMDDYIAVGGYTALSKVLSSLSPDGVINEIKNSGLRGRGGGGFLTGEKWRLTQIQKEPTKYVICNADEGDPGAYMDRSILESNPYSVIEGMAIGAYAIGSHYGWMYVRNEYPLAVENVTKALEQAREYGLLGDNILGSGFNFDIRVAKGAGAFVCGEETALIASIEGKMGIPRQRPLFPSECGLFGKPTNINNVETWSTVPVIIRNGAEWFSGIGTENSKGTKIFSLVGKVRNTGLVEVPMGTTIKEVVYGIGGGATDNKKVKAVQMGGPSGGCIPSDMFDLSIDYKSLTGAGAIMGSGGMIVMDENTCMVDVAKYFTGFLKGESCGKCSICREGIQRMHEILCRITEGQGEEEDIETLEQLGSVIKDASLCGLGQTAPNPVLATLRYFREEYLEHINKKRCPAGACKEIISSPCQYACPINTDVPAYIGLIAQERFEEALRVIKKDNPLSSVLARVCHHPCEVRCSAGDGGKPISIRSLKRFVTDYGLKENLLMKSECDVIKKDEKVAVVGSGPAGLACAHELAVKGYDVTIFEKLDVIGGMLAVAIPEYRLPRDVLKADIEYILSAGIKVRTNIQIGKDIKIDALFEDGYKAVFVALGAHRSMNLGIPGEDAEGVFHGLEVLHSINTGKPLETGKHVGIIGGGNSAVDVARALLRTGTTASVTIFYRRTQKEMPAFTEEVEAALEEGINIEFLTAPVKIVRENNKLAGCEFTRMKLGDTDKSGRRAPVPIDDSQFLAKLDTLILAIGERPDTSSIEGLPGIKILSNGTIEVSHETYETNRIGVFAGGDASGGPNTVINAVASGKAAAKSIMQYLSGENAHKEYSLIRPSIYVKPVELTEEELSDKAYPSEQILPIEKRTCSFDEVVMGFDKCQAVREARRCLRCDLETKDGKSFLKNIREAEKNGKEVPGCLD